MSIPRIVSVVGSPSAESRTRSLAQALTEAVTRRVPARVETLELRHLVPAIGHALRPDDVGPEGRRALRSIAEADLLVVATPVYKGSYGGLFKHLFDLVPPDALVDRPVLLAATGGSDRHALVVDHQLRPLFAFFRALTLPSAVYGADADFDGTALRDGPLRVRIEEAAGQAARVLADRHPAPARVPTPIPA